MMSVLIHRHRSNGLRNLPGAAPGAAAAGPAPGFAAAAVPVGAEKIQMQPQQPGQVYAQPSGNGHAAPVPAPAYAAAPQQGYYGQPPAPQQAYPQESFSLPPQPNIPTGHSAGSNIPAQNTGPYMPSQTTGGSYVQGAPVPFPNSNDGQQIHETHGQSYNPNAPRELS